MRGLIKRWWKDDDASAAIEAGMLFPVMLSMLMGIVDMGMALNANQKLVNATGMMADLLAQQEDVTDNELLDIVAAGRLALTPYNTVSFGYDVVSIRFIDEDLDPVIQWRDIDNMEPNINIETQSEGLGYENEGVVAVTLNYTYTPFFTNFVVGTFDMEEVSIARNRKGVFVSRS